MALDRVINIYKTPLKVLADSVMIIISKQYFYTLQLDAYMPRISMTLVKKHKNKRITWAVGAGLSLI